jgi:hypothetical protein
VSEEQLSWLKEGLQSANNAGQTEGLLIHSFPSGLKASGSEVMKVIRKFNVRLAQLPRLFLAFAVSMKGSASFSIKVGVRSKIVTNEYQHLYCIE